MKKIVLLLGILISISFSAKVQEFEKKIDTLIEQLAYKL